MTVFDWIDCMIYTAFIKHLFAQLPALSPWSVHECLVELHNHGLDTRLNDALSAVRADWKPRDVEHSTIKADAMMAGIVDAVHLGMNDILELELAILEPALVVCDTSRESIVSLRQDALVLVHDDGPDLGRVFRPRRYLSSHLQKAIVPYVCWCCHYFTSPK